MWRKTEFEKEINCFNLLCCSHLVWMRGLPEVTE
jgi:hypothetical protein